MTTIHLLFFVSAYALLFILAQPIPEDIKWGECDGIYEIYNNMSSVEQFLCGTMTVPLDYSDPDDERTHIMDLFKIPAQSGQSKGTIIMSMGGPAFNAPLSFGPLGSNFQQYVSEYFYPIYSVILIAMLQTCRN